MKKLSLYGAWNLTGKGPQGDIACIAQIPGDFHSALLKAGIIKDPYYAMNESAVQWIGRTAWTIERSFSFTPESGAHTYLVFTDIDTFFTVFINGKACGSGTNMFCRYRFDVTDLLIKGRNTIRIVFDSAENKAVEAGKKLPYPIPYSIYPVYSPNRNLVRKVQCHGGWDWGPCLMVSGIYGTAELETTAEGWFENATVRYTEKKSASADIWTAKAAVQYTSLTGGDREFTFTIAGGTVSSAAPVTKTVTVHVAAGIHTVQASLTVSSPVLWMTSDELKDAGIKENTIYSLTVSAASKGCKDTAEIKKNIAFRRLAVIAKEDRAKKGETAGKGMYFELNGRPVFAKGADWIPCDALPSRQTDDVYRRLLQSAADAGMNIIRIWGGGQYEKEIFYDLCDRLGIMIWHDCMFACSLYPSTQPFLDSVAQELDYQIPRLETHACIALWCGNNEDIGAISWYEESRRNRDRYIIDYDRLNSGVVEKAVAKWDPDRAWWPSSPCAGPNDFSDNWHSDNRGDMHFWSVWHEKSSFDAYLSIKPRFVSEFGYESFPSFEAVKTYAPADQFNLTSPVLEYHQRSNGGNTTILENFSRYFRFPLDFKSMLYLSQVQQALAIKTAVEYWRTLKPHCMGSIFWQLNDVWPVASWSSIEYSGKWKLLQYAAKDFYAPVSLPLCSKEGEVFACVSNDTARDIDAAVTVHILHFDGSEAVKPVIIMKSIKADTVLEVWRCRTDALGEKPSSCFVYLELAARSSDGKKNYTAENTLFPALYKQCMLEKPAVAADVEEGKTPGIFTITLTAARPAFFTALDCAGIAGRFDRNMLTLLPGKKTAVHFTADSSRITAQRIKKALSVISLRDTY